MPKAWPIRATREPSLAEPEHAQSLAREVDADAALPAALAQGGVLRRNMSGGRQDQRPGQLDGRRRIIAGRGDRDAALAGRLEVDRSVAQRGRADQLQLRQAFEDRARQGRPARGMTHTTSKGASRSTTASGIGQMRVEHG
ncbi:MAG: hypothetical protein WDN69_28925 [Aliidongia sp.]